jgi:hypothetical protein
MGERSIKSARGAAMATKKAPAKEKTKAPAREKAKAAAKAKGPERKTEKLNIWLDPQQAAWLKSKKNISETARALITEAMNMERLVASVKKKKKG